MGILPSGGKNLRRLAILPLSIKPAGLAAFDVAIATDAKTTFHHF
jgi:hypothetical protein